MSKSSKTKWFKPLIKLISGTKNDASYSIKEALKHSWTAYYKQFEQPQEEESGQRQS